MSIIRENVVVMVREKGAMTKRRMNAVRKFKNCVECRHRL